jgi:hypothetical protein
MRCEKARVLTVLDFLCNEKAMKTWSTTQPQVETGLKN